MIIKFEIWFTLFGSFWPQSTTPMHGVMWFKGDALPMSGEIAVVQHCYKPPIVDKYSPEFQFKKPVLTCIKHKKGYYQIKLDWVSTLKNIY